ncbi:MAG: FliO/MopB family protein [Alphaproteobacteria bacterium]|nr:FliO/MopB family protein [Alphaproteobacteria bacterium]MBF0129548.1 FliO/MopB family protein [Alphaproteobacteria bacterium]
MVFDDYTRFVLALVFVIGLILVTGWAVRRFGFGVHSQRFGGRQDRRLALVEALQVDPKRRLVLVRRDDVEHLLLLGGGADLVVENVVPPSSFPEALAASGTGEAGEAA